MEKKLYRSVKEKKICGVCGGLAEYFSIDPTIIRVVWAVLACCGGMGLLAYLLCALIMPEEPSNVIEAGK